MTTPGNPLRSLKTALERYVQVQDAMKGAATEEIAPPIEPLPLYVPTIEPGTSDGIHP